MKDYISREEVLKLAYTTGRKPTQMNPYGGLKEVVDITDIEDIPSADVRPVVRSEWKFHENGNGTCMNCNFTFNVARWLNFCPHCGADMRGMYKVIHHKKGEENV